MIVRASAPNRILDIGSWTDTAFAEHGAVLNGAVDAFAHVTLRPRSRRGVAIRHDADSSRPAFSDFLQAVARYFDVDSFEVALRQDYHAGMGLGANAAIAVALTAAVARFAGKDYHNLQIAIIAQQIRSEELGRPCGMHGYLSAALGGISLYRLTPYPRAFAESVPEGWQLYAELERRLLVVRTGAAPRHDLYAAVERRYQAGDTRTHALLWQLRKLPERGFRALMAYQFTEFGRVLSEQALLQQHLCPELLTPEARHIARVADEFGATACNVNGVGGSMTLYCTPDKRLPLQLLLRQVGVEVLPVKLEPTGLRVWTEPTSRRVPPILTGTRMRAITRH